MSLVFNDTTNNNGIIQAIERTIFGDDGIGRITGNTTLFKNFTSDVNLAFSRVLTLIFEEPGALGVRGRPPDDDGRGGLARAGPDEGPGDAEGEAQGEGVPDCEALDGGGRVGWVGRLVGV